MAAFYDVQNKVIYGKNGTEFAFKGLKHNINELKSYEGADYCWVEEAQAVSNKSWETLIPTIRKENSEIWICFNPKNATDPTWQRFVARERANAIVKKVGWQDNPFFPKVLEDERLDLLATDPEAYEHVWEGAFDTRYSGSVYAKFINFDRIKANVKHDPNYPVYTAWDRGYGDATAIIWYQVGAGEIFIIDYYEENQQDVKHYCEVLAGKKIIVDSVDMETMEVIGWHYGEDIPEHAHRQAYNYHPTGHYVPHDAASKLMEAGGRSMVAQAKKFGVMMMLIPATDQSNSEEALRATLPKAWINSERCGDLVHNLTHYHYEYDQDRGRYSKLPYHDWSSNGCDAAEIMARVWRDTVKPTTQKELHRAQVTAKFHRAREQAFPSKSPYRVKPVRGK